MTHEELLDKADAFDKDMSKSNDSRALVRLLASAVRELMGELEGLESQLQDVEDSP